MAVLPRTPADLALAPVAAAIDRNLQLLRARTPQEIDEDVTVELDVWTSLGGPEDRARWITALATRSVDLHSWRVAVTDDHARIHLEGGSVQLDLGLSPSIRDWLEHGAASRTA